MQNNHPRILVVNDDPASLLALSSLLTHGDEEHAYEIMSARSGEEALRQVLRYDFAVILLDVDMPGMDGFETAEAIHQRPRSASVPIIFVTAYLADEMNRLKGYQKGAVDYLFTPIIPQILQAKVAVFVALARKNLELHRQADMLNAQTEALLKTNQRLQQEVEERKLAERQNRAKDEFLAMLGHELRNPLSAISSAASLLATDAAGSSQRAAGIIRRQSQHLSHIVDDLLDLSRVMSRKIMLSRQSVDLAGVLDSCVETLRAAGRTDGHALELHHESVWVDADPTRLEQIIVNLLDNALKYTPDGGCIRVAVADIDGEACLSVADNGVGIAADLLPHVFDVFVQGKRSLDRAGGGLGIGLALVRQLVELHGGTIEAHSEGAGRGSVFVVRLPAVAPAQPVQQEPQTAVAGPQRVLIIDDNPDGLEMMSLLLTAHGFAVLQAQDGLSGVELALSDVPDVALVDIGLPGIDGYEVARRLRADPATRPMRLVALTGYGLQDDVRRALAAGFDRHMVKPVDIRLLLEELAGASPAGATAVQVPEHEG